MLVVFVVESSRRLTKAGKPFHSLRLRSEGGIEQAAVLWAPGEVTGSSTEPEAEQCWAIVDGEAGSFNGKEQITVRKYRLLTGDEHAKAKSLCRPLPVVDPVLAQESIFSRIKDDPHLEKLIADIFQEIRDSGFGSAFEDCPAATYYHHARRAGLLQHIWEMLDLAEGVLATLATSPRFAGLRIDANLVLAGCILHDLGKVFEYDGETLKYRNHPLGNLLGHVVVGVMLVERFWPVGADSARKLRMEHVLAAHHGTCANGSPVTPRTPEAFVLHTVDMLSARLDQFRSAQEAFDRGETTEAPREIGGFFDPSPVRL